MGRKRRASFAEALWVAALAAGLAGAAPVPDALAQGAVPCAYDLDDDGRVGREDLGALSDELGRTDCFEAPPCLADPDVDGDVDGWNLSGLAHELGREDCPVEVDPFEPNDSLAAATPVECGPGGTLLPLALEPRGDVDFFSFDTPAGVLIRASTRGPVEDNPDTVLQIWDPALNPVAFNDDVGDSFFSEALHISQQAGTHVVGVASFGDSDFNGGADALTGGLYALELLCLPVPADELEPNDTAETAAPLPCPAEITDALVLNPLGDVDFFRFSAEAGQPVVVETSGPVDGAPDTVIQVWAPSGAVVAVNDDVADSFFSRVDFTAPETGEYILGVTSFDDVDFDGGEDAETLGPYHLRVSCSGSPVPQ
ncbi:MAG: hypothetical protein Kow0092_28620 [Deferrisomatales bacterium]